MFKARSYQLERIDTGDYTPEEYDVFLREIRLVNHFAGDIRALKKTLLREIKKTDLQDFSVLDVGVNLKIVKPKGRIINARKKPESDGHAL